MRKKTVIDPEKLLKLHVNMAAMTSKNVMVAFSGGVDSALVLKLACEAAEGHGTDVHAVTLQMPMMPEDETSDAGRAAAEYGAIHQILEIDALTGAGIEDNPKDRCYRCKHFMFSGLREFAQSIGIKTVIDGTNADDMKVYRPGIRALDELGIKSPLRDAGLTKADVRALAAEYGIKAADKPSSPCLATRFPYGTRLTPEALKRAADAEAYLRGFDLYNVRVRVHGDTARIESDEDRLAYLLENRKVIAKKLKALGYGHVSLDLEGYRSGSFDAAEIDKKNS